MPLTPELATGPGARPADDDELSHVVLLSEAARAELIHERGGPLLLATMRPVNPLELSEAIVSGSCTVVVGTYDDAVVGVGIARHTEVEGARLGVVELLYVEPDAREVGVGEAILEAVTRWCEASGCSGLDVAALPGTRAAKSFFEEMGFRARLLVMHRRLQG